MFDNEICPDPQDQPTPYSAVPDQKLPSMIKHSETLYPRGKRDIVTERPWRLDCYKVEKYSSGNPDKFYFRTKEMAKFMGWWRFKTEGWLYAKVVLVHQPTEKGVL